MTKFRVLKTSYIQDGLHEPGDIVDIDPDTVNPEDDNLERIEEKKTAPKAAPVAPAAEVVPSTKHDDEKKSPAKPDVSTPKAVIVSPDGKESPIAKPAPEKPVPAPAPEKAAADDKKAVAKDDQKDAAPEKPASGKP